MAIPTIYPRASVSRPSLQSSICCRSRAYWCTICGWCLCRPASAWTTPGLWRARLPASLRHWNYPPDPSNPSGSTSSTGELLLHGAIWRHDRTCQRRHFAVRSKPPHRCPSPVERATGAASLLIVRTREAFQHRLLPTTQLGLHVRHDLRLAVNQVGAFCRV